MNLEKAREFYLLVKAHFNQDEFNKFYDYFELTWLILEEKDDVKFNFNIWSYFNKFDFINSRNKKTLISDSLLEEYIFISNNCCESLNNLMNNFVEINAKVDIDRFETIIKALFIRLECNRSNINQRTIRIILKQLLSDVLLDIIILVFGVNGKIINEDQFKKLKLKPNENTI